MSAESKGINVERVKPINRGTLRGAPSGSSTTNSNGPDSKADIRADRLSAGISLDRVKPINRGTLRPAPAGGSSTNKVGFTAEIKGNKGSAVETKGINPERVKPISRVTLRPAPSGSNSTPEIKGDKVLSAETKGINLERVKPISRGTHRPVPSGSSSTSVAKKKMTKEVKGKVTSSKTSVKTSVKREKKVYSLAGQKYDPPEEREPLRIFYESLSKQIPSSEMAEFWLMEHGMLSPDRAKRAYEKKQRRQKELRMGTPVKTTPARPVKPESSTTRQQQQATKNGEIKAKRKVANDSDEDDFILSPKRRKV